MKIVVVGGGSGGHITPAVAVVRELLKQAPRVQIEFWTDRKYYKNVVKLTTELGVAWGEKTKTRAGRRGQYVRVRKVAAGKFRRYSGWGVKESLEHFGFFMREMVWGNIVGGCGFFLGLWQSFWRLMRRAERPDVIFLKGGFVSLPVGMAARVLRIPYVIHESDVAAGLANRVLAKHAAVVALGIGGAPLGSETGLDMENSSAEARPQVTVGIPVGEEFRAVSAGRQRALKRALGFEVDKPLVIFTGGSQGALHIDQAVREILPELLKLTSVGLVAGRQHYEEMIDLKKYEIWEGARLKSNFRMWEFSTVMSELMGAADVVVSRAGATTIAELAGLKKAVVLVPFEKLPNGHQVRNAERLAEMGAVEVVMDARMCEQPGVLFEAVRGLVRSPKRRERMAERLHELARPEAAKDLAEIVLKVGKGVGKNGAKK